MRMKSLRRSAISPPMALSTPGAGGTTTEAMFSSRARKQASRRNCRRSPAVAPRGDGAPPNKPANAARGAAEGLAGGAGAAAAGNSASSRRSERVWLARLALSNASSSTQSTAGACPARLRRETKDDGR